MCPFILPQNLKKIKHLWYNGGMDFTFSIGWLVGGLAIAGAGGAVVFFHRQIAENMASGVASYDKVKLFGVITIVVGLLVAMNLHTLILGLLVHWITGK